MLSKCSLDRQEKVAEVEEVEEVASIIQLREDIDAPLTVHILYKAPKARNNKTKTNKCNKSMQQSSYDGT